MLYILYIFLTLEKVFFQRSCCVFKYFLLKTITVQVLWRALNGWLKPPSLNFVIPILCLLYAFSLSTH